LAFVSTTVSPITRQNENTVTIPIIEKRIEPSVRVLLWKNSIHRAVEYPILGRGTGTDAAFLRYQVVSGQDQLLRDAHQAWLNVLGQAGILGLAAFVALCVYLISICRFRIDATNERSTMLVACSCAFLGAFLFQNLFGSFEDARQLWVLIGMLVGLAGTRSHG
jgi:O-antigen ligase